MDFQLKFNMDNAAFGENTEEANDEVARILRDVRWKVLACDGEGYVLDVNGNTIGEWSINE